MAALGSDSDRPLASMPTRPRPGTVGRPRSVLVLTVVHHPEDSRIRQRQIAALVDAGWEVTYAAPFTAFGLSVPPAKTHGDGGRLSCLDLPRARARDRLAAWGAARGVLRSQAARHDLVLVHDPELLVVASGLKLGNLVWDVHEDPAAALSVKTWMPRRLQRPVAVAWRCAERLTERRHHLLLSEYAYQHRFRRPHPVVPNAVRVPRTLVPSAPAERVSYLGSVTRSRGLDTMIAVAQKLRRCTRGGITLEVIGEAADPETARALRRAVAAGDLSWLGFLRNDQALERVSGALAGLCLLQDLPNYRGSLPTKILEYCAVSVPVITTPLPLAAELVEAAGVGVVVPFDDVDAVVDAVLTLRANHDLRVRLGRRGRDVAQREHDWARQSCGFVATLADLADQIDRPSASRRGFGLTRRRTAARRGTASSSRHPVDPARTPSCARRETPRS